MGVRGILQTSCLEEKAAHQLLDIWGRQKLLISYIRQTVSVYGIACMGQLPYMTRNGVQPTFTVTISEWLKGLGAEQGIHATHGRVVQYH